MVEAADRLDGAAEAGMGAASGPEAIAVVGIGCRFPGGLTDPTSLWRGLCAGVSGIREIPADRWSREGFYDPDPDAPGRSVTKWGGFLSDYDAFDADFFCISPREAEAMDPQQRLLLELAWEALEDAGIAPDRIAGTPAAVFIGVSTCDYGAIQRLRRVGDVHAGTGAALSIIANRLSHRYDLRGPSAAVDTACSSSLVATHLACRALQSGEANLALAGGVNSLFEPAPFLHFSRANMMSPTGRIATFDHRADGYVRGEGAAIVVLKRLADAVADGERIHAVIRATAINQDGRTPTMTSPSSEAQAAMLRAVCARAGVPLAGVGYVEAHGTGTPVGDPIEADAIGRVFGPAQPDGARLLVGSIKTNVGHLEAAAGVAGLIKGSLVVRNGAVPPNLNFERPNPMIPLDELRLEVPRGVTPLRRRDGVRRVVVNSFGFGGTNACALLEEPPAVTPGAAPAAAPGALVVPLSAAGPTALATAARQLAEHLRGDGNQAAFADVVGTLALRRAHLAHRLAVVANASADLAAKLEAFARGEPPPGTDEGRPPGVVSARRDPAQPLTFVFAGQGGQWWGMGRGLLADDPVFRAEVDAFDAIFRDLAGWSVVEELLADEAGSRVDDTVVTQPAIFALQIGLVARWRAWGIEPDLVLGHSFGEVTAAYVAGALALEQAARVIHHRGRLLNTMQGRGAMAAVGVSEAEALALIEGLPIDIAAVNGPSMVTLAGERAAIEALVARLTEEQPDLFCRIVKIDYAAHSRMLEPLRESMLEAFADVEPAAPRVPMISTVTGDLVDGMPLDAEYWWRNVRQGVRFEQALDRALAEGHRAFLEIGPHATLAGLVTGCMAARGVSGLVVASLNRRQDDLETLHAALATLHVRGFPVAWERVVPRGYRFVELPGYPWEKRRLWACPEEARAYLFAAPGHPLLGIREPGARPSWRNELDLGGFRFIADHRVDGAVVFPAAGYLDMMLAAGRELFGDGGFELEGVRFEEAMFLQEERFELVQTVFEPERSRVSVFSRARDGDETWTLRATGRLRHRRAARAVQGLVPRVPAEADWLDGPGFYRKAEHHRFQYGPLFQGVRELRRWQRSCLARIELPEPLAPTAERYHFHPAQLDACIQAGIALLEDGNRAVHLPVGVDRLRYYRRPSGRLNAFGREVSADGRTTVSDLVIADSEGHLVATIDGLTIRRLGERGTASPIAAGLALYRETWHEMAPVEEDDGASVEAAQPGSWVLLADEAGLAAALRERLNAAGGRCLEVHPGDSYRFDPEDGAVIRPAASEDMAALVADLSQIPNLRGVVHLFGLDVAVPPDADDGQALLAAQERGALSVLPLVQVLAGAEGLAPRLWLITRGARDTGDEAAPDDPSGLAQATLVGLARTVANEHAQLRASTVDLDPGLPTPAAADALAAELLADGPETEIALRGQRRLVARLERTTFDAAPPLTVPAQGGDGTRPFRLTMKAPGVLDDLGAVETNAPEPGPGEVLIDVKAVGLNFRDIMAATGLLPEGAESDDPWRALGLECAGTVQAVGPGVEGFAPGDRVMATARGVARTPLALPAGICFRMPAGIDFVQAATIPTAFMTAYYALVTLARLRAGERVLIHVATGGVGLAAIQIARMVGAEIFATAGSERKRAYLRELGIAHVMDSRSLDFADQILAVTGGRGVDVVLNALPGAFIEKGLAVLAPYGRFLELGKRDIYADTAIGLSLLRKNISFFAIDLARMGAERPEEVRALLAQLSDLIAAGTLRPLPAETFTMSRVVDAFRHMSQARHIGKVVLELDDPALRVALEPEGRLALRRDGAYLVTGGLGGFGLEVARFLAAHGAGEPILVGRQGAGSAEAQAAIAELREAGAEVTAVAADVTVRADVERAVTAASRPLRGVVHGAMVLDDGFITQLDHERLMRVLAPKVAGAWNLHRATLGAELDFFVMFSSVAALVGSTGQSNYVAANSFLDAMAPWRRGRGLPALTVNWGALGGAGFVARNEAVARYLETMGIVPLGLDEALGSLGRLLRLDVAQAGAARVDWNRLARGSASMAPRLSHLASQAEGQAAGGRLRGELVAATPARRQAMLERYLGGQIAKVLKIDAGTLPPERPLTEIGLDSLTSFELKNRVETELGITLPVGRFLQNPTIVGLSAAIAERLDSEGAEAAQAGAGTGGAEAQLSLYQEWFLGTYPRDGRLTAFHRHYAIAYAAAVRPRLDTARLRDAFEAVVAAHPTLRWTFPAREGGFGLQVADRHRIGLEVYDLTDLPETAFARLLQARANEVADLARGPLFRVQIFRRPDERDVLLLRSHQLVSDGWSISRIMAELFGRYFGLGAETAAAPFGYADFARWQRELVASEEGAAMATYWREQLRDPGSRLPLPFDRARPEGGFEAGAELSFTVDAPTTAALQGIARDAGATRYTALLAAFKLLLLAYTGRSDVVVTTSAAARTRPEFEPVVGWFVNNLPLRSRLDPSASFRAHLQAVAGVLRDALAHQDYPLHLVLDALRAEHGPDTPLDQVAFMMRRPENLDDGGFGAVWANRRGARLSFGRLEVESVPIERDACVRDLTVYVQEVDGEVCGTVVYSADLFDQSTIARLVADHDALLKAVVARPDAALGDLVAAVPSPLALAGED